MLSQNCGDHEGLIEKGISLVVVQIMPNNNSSHFDWTGPKDAGTILVVVSQLFFLLSLSCVS